MAVDLSALCMTFLMFLNQHGFYEPVKECPHVTIMTVNQLQQIACDGAECPVEAFYDRGEKAIYLSDELDLEFSFHRSILLHELVHYVQDVSDKWEEADTECHSGMRRELNAFRAQEKYLLEQNIHIPVSHQMMFYRC